MTTFQLRNKLHILGYALNYTYGVTREATVYNWKTGVPMFSKTIDMSDPVNGRKELERLYEELK